jgi:cell division septation protein DedD
MASDDTEITLGVGKLLGLFFLLAAICGIFFSIGYSLGRSSGREQALNDQPSQVNAASSPDSVQASTSGSEGKPSAGVAAKADPQAPAADDANANNQQNLTFYKAVQQNDNPTPSTEKASEPGHDLKAASETPQSAKTTTAAATVPVVNAPPAAGTAAAAKPAVAVISHTSPVTGPGTIVVQIAAVSREDDAVALAGALRKKNYNVFVVNNPVTNDKFYHVQVGPFSTMAEAEAMKAQLVAEGYNPIIKK